ncbi:MAG: hypothetical protein UV38_C0003G0123 [candidate division TM6 bacterium GW2011_GWE2_42_60]|nr:MAG: hypothetical protein UV38_C0003G0123 [candidate division TM6 bacterium GW2011_GWE2_42_60]HBY05398.1 hypothetical protein [Candidatus Dependentiae bacterium]
MKTPTSNKTVLALAIAIGVIVVRLIPHPVNCTPIGALSLFAGSVLSPFWAAITLLSALFLGDCFCGFHSTIPFVYGSFLIALFFGNALKTKTSYLRLLFASLSSSLTFFFITNFGSWLTSGMYSHTLNGLLKAYLYAIPFYQSSADQVGSLLGATLFSDLFFTMALFSLFFGIVALRNATPQEQN